MGGVLPPPVSDTLTLHSVVSPSSLVMRARALNTLVYPLLWSAGSLHTHTHTHLRSHTHLRAEQPIREQLSPPVSRHPDQSNLRRRPHKRSGGAGSHPDQSLQGEPQVTLKEPEPEPGPVQMIRPSAGSWAAVRRLPSSSQTGWCRCPGGWWCRWPGGGALQTG